LSEGLRFPRKYIPGRIRTAEEFSRREDEKGTEKWERIAVGGVLKKHEDDYLLGPE